MQANCRTKYIKQLSLFRLTFIDQKVYHTYIHIFTTLKRTKEEMKYEFNSYSN